MGDLLALGRLAQAQVEQDLLALGRLEQAQLEQDLLVLRHQAQDLLALGRLAQAQMDQYLLALGLDHPDQVRQDHLAQKVPHWRDLGVEKRGELTTTNWRYLRKSIMIFRKLRNKMRTILI